MMGLLSGRAPADNGSIRMYLHELLRRLSIAEHRLLAAPPDTETRRCVEESVAWLTRELMECEASRSGPPRSEHPPTTH